MRPERFLRFVTPARVASTVAAPRGADGVERRSDAKFALCLGCFLGILAARFENAPTLAFRAPAPDAMIDAVLQGVFEAAVFDGARRADSFCYLYPDPIAGEESFGWLIGAKASCHPVRFHRKHLRVFAIVLRPDGTESSRKGELSIPLGTDHACLWSVER